MVCHARAAKLVNMEHISQARADTYLVALAVGGNGFLGGFVVSALRVQGRHMLHGGRPHRLMGQYERTCDFARMHLASGWHAALAGVDAVVNAAGILRE